MLQQRKTSRKESSAAVRQGGEAEQRVEEENVEGTIVSSQTITSKTRTVETTTYSVEQEGATETHIEQKVKKHTINFFNVVSSQNLSKTISQGSSSCRPW